MNEDYETVGEHEDETIVGDENVDGSFRERIISWYSSNTGMFWGMLAGLVVAVLFLAVGFFQTLLIIIFVALGGFLGSRTDVRAQMAQFFADIFTKKDKI